MRNVAVLDADGGSVGCVAGAPYDRIVVTAAALVVPGELVAQLADEGVMVVPVLADPGGVEKLFRLESPPVQVVRRVRKKKESVVYETLGTCRFVPLHYGAFR